MKDSNLNPIFDALHRAFIWVKNIVRRIIRGLVNLYKDIVSWFKNLSLIRERDIPFVLKDPKVLKEMIANARTVDLGILGEEKEVIVNGVYNKDTDEITHLEILESDGLDAQCKAKLGNDPLVVLT